MTALTRILVADDHEIVRRGVRALLEGNQGWQVCAEAANGREAVEKARKLKPNLVILDISMPGLNGLEVTRRIRQALPETEVLILTMHESEEMMQEILAAGATGFVLKSDAGRDLVAAVEALGAHRPFLDAKATEVVLGRYRESMRDDDKRRPALLRELTPREREILQLLAEGNTSKDVAVGLGISVKTAETHRSHLMRKLGVHSVSDLVRYAIRNGVIEA